MGCKEIKSICQSCFKEFSVKKTGYWRKRKFCSPKCVGKYQSIIFKGRDLGEKWKEKISQSMRGRKKTIEHQAKITLALQQVKRPDLAKRNKTLCGIKHPNWKGGISSINVLERQKAEYREWRTAVFKRDKFTCRQCGQGGYIEAHHIKSFSEHPDLRTDIDNGITLCKKCHALTDNYRNKKLILVLN